MTHGLEAFATATYLALALAAGQHVVSAQSTGELTGIVRDATGAVVPGATVTVTPKTLPAAPLTIKTDDQGRFGVSLPPGVYHVSVAAARFKSSPRDVEITASGATLEILMEIDLSDTVTVTATRTGTANIQTTGIAITALDAKTLHQTSVERVEHLMGLVPTLSVSQTPGDTPLITLRGIGSNSNVPGTDPNVTMQVDGVYLAQGSAIALDFLDVERVEVLRGPQGTLFGRNSIGGTINIVTRQPTNTFETRGRITAGNYDKLRVEGAISGPLVRDRIMGSFAFLRGSRDGFVADVNHADHSLGSEDTWAGRGQLRFIMGARHELLFSGDYSNAQGVPLPLARPLAAGPNAAAFGGFDTPAHFWSVQPNDLAEGRNRQSGASARLTVRLGDHATLSSLTAYRDGKSRLFIDSDTTERPAATTRTSGGVRQLSQEVTLAHRTARLNWIGGAFWFDERNRGPEWPFELTLPGGVQSRIHPEINGEGWALFGQARYLVADRVALTGGLRYSHEREEGHSIGGQFLRGTSTPLPGRQYDVIDAADDAAWTPKASFELEASRDTFLFLSATRGFKSGGINVTARTAGKAFRPELAWSYEAGLKHTLPDGRGRVNASLFFVDYRDQQVVSFLDGGVLDITNAGRATSKGVEVEGVLSAGKRLQFLGIVSWLDAVYGSYIFEDRLGDHDATGNRLREAPKWSGSASAIYEVQPSTSGTMSVRADATWQSRVFFSPSNTAQQSQAAYALIHARTSFAPRSRRWEVALYVRNLGREEYVTATWAATGDVAISGRPGEPRHWGTQFTIRY